MVSRPFPVSAVAGAPALRLQSLNLYLFRQSLGPMLFFTVVLTAVIWLSQSLRMLDLVINKGQSAGTFLYLTLLLLPSLLQIVLPFAFFFAIVYLIARLISDSELVVMWASGLSRWSVLAPMMAAALVMTLLTLLITLYLMPLGMRTMKDKVIEIRADLVTTLVKEGAFSTPIEGLTVYIKEQSRDGELTGLFVHDNRDTAHPVTYMAAKGVLVRTPDGPRLIMFDGNLQRVDGKRGQISILNFDKYTFDLSAFDQGYRRADRETSERYLSELIGYTAKSEWEEKQRGAFMAEGNNRLASPLYNFVFVLIAAAFLLTGSYSRRGHGWRITFAVMTGAAARLLGFGIQGFAAENGWAVALIWLNPILWMAAATYVIAIGGWPTWATFGTPTQAEPAE